MKEVYMADDGKIFDDSFECECYEFESKYDKDLSNIEFYGVDIEHQLGWDYSDYFYGEIMTIVIHNDAEIAALQALNEFCGWPALDEIMYPGTWIWDKEDYTFVLQEE